MIDKEFYRKNAQDIVNKYRKHIFDPAGGGARAKDVYGKNYPSTYSEPYGTNKKNKTLPRRNAKFARSNAPVLTGQLMNSFDKVGSDTGGFGFGTVTQKGKVKKLANMGRAVSTNEKPVPDEVAKFIMKEMTKDVKGAFKKIRKAIKRKKININIGK